MLDVHDKQMIISAMKGLFAEALGVFLALSDPEHPENDNLAVRVGKLNAATSANADILAAYDELKAYRLPVIDSTFNIAITELRASVTP